MPKFLNLVDVLPMSSADASTSSTGQLTVKFDLNLPKHLSQCTEGYGDSTSDVVDRSRQWSHLPSSLSVRSILGSDAYSSAQRLETKTSYMVQAHVFRNGIMIGSVSREIRVFDSMEPQPPTCLSDFSSEYLCEQKDALRKHIFTRVGVFSAAISEPDPFLFFSGKEFAMTRLPISFAIQGLDAEGRGDANNSTTPFNANVTWQLRTSTFLSVEAMNFVPTVIQARRTPSITLITTLGLRHRLKLALSGWKRPSRRFVFHNMQGIENAWTIEEELALSIPTRSLLPPTFVTPHLSRRYSLIVHIKVAGNGKASVRLEVPVQIVYQRDPTRTGGLHGEILSTSGVLGDRNQSRQILSDNAVSELPVYVP
jgi:hypothetical protein